MISAESRNSVGGTAKQRVLEQINVVRERWQYKHDHVILLYVYHNRLRSVI